MECKMKMRRCVSAAKKKKDIQSQEKRPASGLSWIWTLTPPCNYHQTSSCCPKDERTGPTTSTHLNRWPLPPTALRLSTHESRAARAIWQLHPSAWHKIKEVVERKSRERESERGRENEREGKWFEVMFDNELWVCGMCRGNICMCCFAAFEYYYLCFWCPSDAESSVLEALM